ncbi:DUF6049 family protein [Microterricola viridarii]|uniref:Uncharacterized protein n=1 Tax=Microterricola viridarii TaxID=412690 RepID=A0A0Y0NJA3_9MICO|nr:DUF6049 family protein [Microterricola viridarii]AMB59860.1 hypothetical protein AWU67_14455 [Microterricola viridarii]
MLAAAAILTPALLGQAPASAAPAQEGPVDSSAAAAASDAVSIVVAPGHGAVVRPGEDLQLSATVTNGSRLALSVTRIAIGLSDDTLADSAELSAWLRPSAEVLAETTLDNAGVPDDGHLVAIADGPSVAGGGSATVTITVPAAALELDPSDWGAQGIVASLLSESAVLAQTRSTVVLLPAETPRSPLAIVMPMTTPADSVGLISSEKLATYTGPGGLLTRSLESALAHNVAVALDPMILASIRVLGTSAPQSAVDWLNRLAIAPNEVFALPYADADVAAQAQLGVNPFLEPLSFDTVIDERNFTTETPSPTVAPSETPAPGEAEAPSTAAPGAESETAPPADSVMGAGVPSMKDLLAWPYTLSGVAWPAPDTVNAAILPTMKANGYDTVIVAGSNLQNTESVQPSASSRAADTALLVADTELNGALNDALQAGRESDWQAAMARATAAVAVAAGESPARPLLAVLPREFASNAGFVNATLTALEQMPVASVAPLSAVMAAPASDVTLSEAAESPERLAAISALLDRETALTGFSTAVTDPRTITEPERTNLLALLGVNWLADTTAWHAAVSDDLLRTREILDSVSVVQSPSVLVVGGSAQFPVTVQNTFTQPVTLRVNLLPSNGRLVVDESAEVTINAGSSSTVLVPVNAHVGNGPVNVTVTLSTATGVQLGSSVTIPVNVQADWEGLGAALLGGAILLFFGFGIFRNIRRRRRERAAGEQPAVDEDAGEQESGDSVKPDEEVTREETDEPESPRG